MRQSKGNKTKNYSLPRSISSSITVAMHERREGLF